MNLSRYSRRNFLRTSTAAIAAMSTAPTWAAMDPKSRVSLTSSDDRTANIFNGLKRFEAQIKKEIGNRPVLIKPNNVSTTTPLCATHADCLEGILAFLKSIGKTDKIAIGESAASGPTMEGFTNYNYLQLNQEYNFDFLDLDKEGYQIRHVISEKDFQPHPVRMSRLLLDPEVYVISSAVMKTHDRAVATLSLKNIIFGAPIKDEGFRWGRDRKEGAKNDKPIVHGDGFKGINYNLYAMAPLLKPNLAVIDGYQGMEGNGPVGGTPVEHRVAVVSPDWMSADRVAVELMGIDINKIGYLNYCAKAGMGTLDLGQIEVEGETIADHVKPYKLHDNIEKQLVWM